VLQKITALNFNIFVDHLISARRPDIVVIKKEAAIVSLIDVTLPTDKHISAKEEEKFKKYQDLKLRIITTIPIVIGALGYISMQLEYFLELLEIAKCS